jgi:leucyl/phenylalanyl-tRNA---protein transferase
MPVFRLTEDLVFPRPEMARDDGLLAVGGDLSNERILLAYSLGIFPWFSEGSPILWWSPDPRLVLFPDELKISRSLGQVIKKGLFKVTTDAAFEEVIRNCSDVRREGQRGTWITEEMIAAYISLHQAGYAHSVESWYDEKLAGGLYGIALGRAFFGESMFTKRNNASKIAFVKLIEQLRNLGFEFIDCQVSTEHLKSLGAREIPRSEFLRLLKKALARSI